MNSRKNNEEKYSRLMVIDDEIKNAIICNEIADDSLTWNPGEAIYWRKKAIEKIEKLYGKENIESTEYYDKLVNDLLEKGSYQQGVKWNNLSKKIKIQEKGQYSFEVIINELYEMELNIFLNKCDGISDNVEYVKSCLQKYQDANFDALYHIYSKLIHIGLNYRIYVQNELKDIMYFADKAIELAYNYGEESMEIVEAFRMKAIVCRKTGLGQENNEMALELLKKALLIALKIERNKGKKVKEIFYHIQMCWHEDIRWQESVMWICKHISKEVMLDIKQVYPIFIQSRITEIINAIE